MKACNILLRSILLFNFFVIVCFSNATAGLFEEKKFDFGIAPGVLLPGEIYISLYGDNVNQKSTFFIRGYIDAYVIPQIAFGVYINYTTLNLEEDIQVFCKEIKKSGTSVMGIGAAIKPRFVLSPKIAIKPGFNIGHRQYYGDADFSKWKGLALNGSCEIQYRLSEKLLIFEETGFLTQPYGGNVDTDVTFGPIFYLGFGIAY